MVQEGYTRVVYTQHSLPGRYMLPILAPWWVFPVIPGFVNSRLFRVLLIPSILTCSHRFDSFLLFLRTVFSAFSLSFLLKMVRFKPVSEPLSAASLSSGVVFRFTVGH